MKFYVITMMDSPDRVENVNRIIRDYRGEFEFEVFPAVVPNDEVYLDPGYDFGYRRKHFGYQLTKGEIGCFRSHREIWKKISIESESIVGIIEDDVMFIDGIFEAIKIGMLWQNYWDVLRLHQAIPQKTGVKIASNGVQSLYYYLMPPRGTSAYLLKRSSAECLAKRSVKIRHPVDHFLDDHRQHALNVLDLSPATVNIKCVPSVIGHRGWNRDMLGSRNIYRLLQRDIHNFGEQAARFGRAMKLVTAKLSGRSF